MANFFKKFQEFLRDGEIFTEICVDQWFEYQTEFLCFIALKGRKVGGT